jgi:hypothetical protein
MILKYIKHKLSPYEALPLEKNNQKHSNKKKTQLEFSSFGKSNSNKIFYVIKRSPGAGLFSNFIYVLNHLKIASSNNFIPIVDMENFITIYNEKLRINKTFNAWNYYFETKIKINLSKVYNSKKIIFSTNKYSSDFKHNIDNKEFRNLFNKWFKIKKIFLLEADKFYQKFFYNQKTLAIHYRGTSYKTSANHPFPATFKQVDLYIKKLLIKGNYTKIFLCTEDLKFLNFIKKKYGNLIVYKDSYRSFKDDAFKIYPRKSHRYQLGKEILLESLIISKCDAFLHATTNVSEFVKFLDKKKQIKYFKLDNGLNSSNEYVAKWLWYYKSLMPTSLGGFKIK